MADKYNPGRSSPSPRLPALLLLIHLLCSLRAAHGGVFPTEAALSTRWTSTPAMPNTTNFDDGSQLRPVLLRPLGYIPRFSNSYAYEYPYEYEYAYACGFYCRGACDSFLFAVFIIPDVWPGIFTADHQLVWAANRDRPVRENATLQLGSDGDLVLTDADGTKVWSSGTSGKPVAGLNLTESGNLVLFGGDDKNNQSIWWESFAYPTDSLLPGQKLRVGQSLTANDSPSNSTPGLYYLSATPTGLFAFVKSDPTASYASLVTRNPLEEGKDYFVFMNGSISTSNSSADEQYKMPASLQFLRLEFDGHLRAYEWSDTDRNWVVVNDVLTPGDSPTCFDPMVCGRYGVCNAVEQCCCPQGDDDVATAANYFVPVDIRNPQLGCREVTPQLSCGSHGAPRHRLLRLDNISYFSLYESSNYPHVVFKTDEQGCRSACLRNCSCKAAFFGYFNGTEDAVCYLTSEVFSLMGDRNYSITAFIKVQSASRKRPTGVILGSTMGALCLLLLCTCICSRILKKKIQIQIKWKRRDEEGDLEQVSGMPRRFSLEELRAATDGFGKKLGQGGFGSVYEGRVDAKRVAVKRLDGVGHQGGKEFLAEVQTIGKIHHVNLVKLIGYCAEQSCRLLVYEFMPRGSLDRWIFRGARGAQSLYWHTRCNIILGVAKGLSYLHEECSQRIAHLDVKPQNILLDDNFDPKISDFGLAKLIDRDQTHVETRMRGTRGYLAPEWLSSKISEKADVYSFGVVVLEIICGRRNLDRSQPEEAASLVALLKRKVEDGELLDLVDESIAYSGFNIEEAMKVIKIATWCLQDQNTRPSMSMVVKVLEGTVDVEFDIEGMFQTSSVVEGIEANTRSSAPLSASILSGPR